MTQYHSSKDIDRKALTSATIITPKGAAEFLAMWYDLPPWMVDQIIYRCEEFKRTNGGIKVIGPEERAAIQKAEKEK